MTLAKSPRVSAVAGGRSSIRYGWLRLLAGPSCRRPVGRQPAPGPRCRRSRPGSGRVRRDHAACGPISQPGRPAGSRTGPTSRRGEDQAARSGPMVTAAVSAGGRQRAGNDGPLMAPTAQQTTHPARTGKHATALDAYSHLHEHIWADSARIGATGLLMRRRVGGTVRSPGPRLVGGNTANTRATQIRWSGRATLGQHERNSTIQPVWYGC